jgi:hypothetical protein
VGLLHRRSLERHLGVSADALWGAVKAALPSVITQASFYEGAHRVEWTLEQTALDWAESMSATVREAADGGAVVTVEGHSAHGFGPHSGPSMLGPGRRAKAMKTLLDNVSDAVAQLGEAAAQPAVEDAYRYWNGREWTAEAPPAPPEPPTAWPAAPA